MSLGDNQLERETTTSFAEIHTISFRGLTLQIHRAIAVAILISLAVI